MNLGTRAQSTGGLGLDLQRPTSITEPWSWSAREGEPVLAEHGVDEGEDALRGGRARRHGKDHASRLRPRRDGGVVNLPPPLQEVLCIPGHGVIHKT